MKFPDILTKPAAISENVRNGNEVKQSSSCADDVWTSDKLRHSSS